LLGALMTGATGPAAGEDGGANGRCASKFKRDEGVGEAGELFGDSDGGLAWAKAVVEITHTPAAANEIRSKMRI
jgi:hypothetical protein